MIKRLAMKVWNAIVLFPSHPPERMFDGKMSPNLCFSEISENLSKISDFRHMLHIQCDLIKVMVIRDLVFHVFVFSKIIIIENE